MSEVRGQRSEDRGRKSEVGSQRSEVSSQRSEEQIAVGDDIVLTRLTLPVCSHCRERYYDRKAIRLIEQVRAKGKKRLLDDEDVGKVLRVREHDPSVSQGL